MEQRARTSAEQFSILIEFMERNGDIARPQSGAQGRIKSDRLWQQLTDTLNSVGGGIAKPSEKWKKVWADWKSKTKNKSKEIRKHSRGTGGGPNCKITLTALEERVLAVMGVLAVEGQAGIEEIGFNRQTHGNSSFGVDIILPDLASSDVGTEELAGSSTLTNEPPAPPRPPPVTTSQQSLPPAQTATAASTSRREATPPPPTTTRSPADTPRRRLLHAQRRRRAQTPFDRATSEFAAVELRRQHLEERREQNLHERESRRIAVEAEAVSVLKRLADVAERFLNREH